MKNSARPFAPAIKPKALAGYIRPLLSLAIVAVSVGTFVFMVSGANPTSATISPTTSTPVTWVGIAPGGASNGEATCNDGVNCDVFKITTADTEADWAANIIALRLKWNVAATDYDFYIHKGSVTGPTTSTGKNGGAPDTGDDAAIDPAATGVGDYFVHVVYFLAVLADEYRGTATVASKATAVRTASYVDGGITFSPNVALKAPVSGRDGEPSDRADFKGNCYVGGIRGVPACVDL